MQKAPKSQDLGAFFYSTSASGAGATFPVNSAKSLIILVINGCATLKGISLRAAMIVFNSS